MLEYKELNENSNYLIYNDGRVYSKRKKIFLKGKVDNIGYRHYCIKVNGKNKYLYAHRLVAQYFIPNPNNLPVVNHIDENRLNNHVNNLEWVTYQENCCKFINNNPNHRKNTSKPKYYKKDLPNEKWAKYKGCSKYIISNFGRVRNERTNRLLYLDDKHTYARVVLMNDNGAKKHYAVHRLVYSAFTQDYDLKGFVVDHIDANPLNNNLDNLQKITQSENTLKQARFQK